MVGVESRGRGLSIKRGRVGGKGCGINVSELKGGVRFLREEEGRRGYGHGQECRLNRKSD